MSIFVSQKYNSPPRQARSAAATGTPLLTAGHQT